MSTFKASSAVAPPFAFLPRTQMLPSEAHPTLVPGIGRPFEGQVLLVEDDDQVAALASEMLQSIGFAVTRVASAAAALGALANERPVSLVFSDIMMPGGISGVELACEIRVRRCRSCLRRAIKRPPGLLPSKALACS
jgi:PleD family two-component response regulator